MASKKDKAVRPKLSAAQRMEKRGAESRKYTVSDCMKMGRTANILFVVFIIYSLIYYYSFSKFDGLRVFFEVTAYSIEATAFALFSIGVIWLDRLVRSRIMMKILLLVYIVAEIILMLLEFQWINWFHYNGLNKPLVIIHVIFSAGIALSTLVLDLNNPKQERITAITTIIISAGMFFAFWGYRVYASILLNAFAYIFFFSAMLHQLRLEEIDIDCYGDAAKISTFDSSMFANTPTMVEKPVREKPQNIKEAVSRAKDRLESLDEKTVLTDKTEKFEYEFGVQADDDDGDEEP